LVLRQGGEIMGKKKDKKEEKHEDQEKTMNCCYVVDPCGCYSYFYDPCGCAVVDPCCC